jgi:6-pyruvoyltetrahydropterin/6-carboxytetrahydropterin synthase
MFEVGVVTQFEAAHRLRGDFGPATRLHGHTYRVEIALRGPSLQADSTLCDIGRLQEAVQQVVSSLHYRDLDDHEGLNGKNTTAEVVAHYLWMEIASGVRSEGVRTMTVRVWESPQAYAAYEGEL